MYEELTGRIISCAFKVYNTMGFGYLESVYERCLLIELRKAGLTAESKIPITVFYEQQIVGEFIADILVEDTIIIELKSVRQLAKFRGRKSRGETEAHGFRKYCDRIIVKLTCLCSWAKKASF